MNLGVAKEHKEKMAAFSTVIDFVSFTISRCIQCIGSEDLSDLDMILLSLSSSSAQIGGILDEVLVTRERHIEDDALTDLRQLHLCLNQLYMEYETKLFYRYRRTTTQSPRGRPKKIINLSMVCCNS